MTKRDKDELDAIRAAITNADTKQPSNDALAELRRVLDAYPYTWKLVGDLALQAQQHIMHHANVSAVMSESVHHGMRVMRRELGWEDAPQLERLLIEHVVICWLRYYLADMAYTSAMHSNTSIAVCEFHERRLTAAQTRFVRASESLARVRRLGIAIQINLGHQQVNVQGELPPHEQQHDV